MSSISSGLDPTVKYQRLSAEYVKVRNQVSILKTALLEEQAKSAQLQRELTVQDTALRKAESERDSLNFRNDQLVKRVESLQESLEGQMAAFGTGKGKKKHKEANLRLVAEHSRMQHQAALGGGSSAATDPQTIMEEELERKIVENGELHSKLFDVERRFDEATNQFLRRIEELERENGALRLRDNSSINGSAENGNSMTNLAEKQREENEENNAMEMDTNAGEELKNVHQKEEENDYYTERIATLTNTLQHATGRATYYKQECEELIRRHLVEQTQIDELQKKIHGLEDKCGMLYEILETTQQNYEEQMRNLNKSI